MLVYLHECRDVWKGHAAQWRRTRHGLQATEAAASLNKRSATSGVNMTKHCTTKARCPTWRLLFFQCPLSLWQQGVQRKEGFRKTQVASRLVYHFTFKHFWLPDPLWVFIPRPLLPFLFMLSCLVCPQSELFVPYDVGLQVSSNQTYLMDAYKLEAFSKKSIRIRFHIE